MLGHKRARTEILDDYSGILEIDHPGRQLMEWKARRWDWDNSALRITGIVHIYLGLHAFSNHIMMCSQLMRLSRVMAVGATPRSTNREGPLKQYIDWWAGFRYVSTYKFR
jgi:hypothetical protein